MSVVFVAAMLGLSLVALLSGWLLLSALADDSGLLLANSTTAGVPSANSTKSTPEGESTTTGVLLADSTTAGAQLSTVTTTEVSPTTMVAPSPLYMSGVCDTLTGSFNSFNKILPMVVNFDEGETVGIKYPKGKIVFKSEARKLNNCISYPFPFIDKPQALIVHLEVEENMQIQFPNYTINNQNWNLIVDVDSIHLVLHYHVAEVSANGVNKLDMKVLMCEIKELGRVTILSDFVGLNGTDYTLQAEDLIRPKLFEAVNNFTQLHLNWLIDPLKDSSMDGFEAFKLIFKRTMISLDNAYKGQE